MKRNDVTVEILKEIRDELRDIRAEVHGTNDRIDQTNIRLDQTNERLEQTNERIDQTNERVDWLGRHVVGVEVRLATEIVAFRGEFRTMIDLMRGQIDLRPRVERCETDIASLKEQVGRIG